MEIFAVMPERESRESVLLFVHGAFHGAWCWQENFMPYFAEHGYSTYAFSFSGHCQEQSEEEQNIDIDKYDLEDYLQDLRKVITLLGNKPILIGHSMGGAVVQMLMEQDPDLIKGAVLISATPPDGLRFSVSMRMLMNGMGEMNNLYCFSRGKVNLEEENPKFPFKCFFSETLEKEKQKKYASKMQMESIVVAKSFMRKIVSKVQPSTVPMLVMGGEDDWFLPSAVFERTAKAYEAELKIIPALSHDAMLDTNWQAAADAILEFFEKHEIE